MKTILLAAFSLLVFAQDGVKEVGDAPADGEFKIPEEQPAQPVGEEMFDVETWVAELVAELEKLEEDMEEYECDKLFDLAETNKLVDEKDIETEKMCSEWSEKAERIDEQLEGMGHSND